MMFSARNAFRALLELILRLLHTHIVRLRAQPGYFILSLMRCTMCVRSCVILCPIRYVLYIQHENQCAFLIKNGWIKAFSVNIIEW